MAQRRTRAAEGVRAETPRAPFPAGTPAWITHELIEHTRSVWQPRYENPLSIEDAIGILTGAARLMRTLQASGSRDVASGQKD